AHPVPVTADVPLWEKRENKAPAIKVARPRVFIPATLMRSEEHTSELQSRFDLVCRLLLEKKKDRFIFAAQHGHEAVNLSSLIGRQVGVEAAVGAGRRGITA